MLMGCQRKQVKKTERKNANGKYTPRATRYISENLLTLLTAIGYSRKGGFSYYDEQEGGVQGLAESRSLCSHAPAPKSRTHHCLLWTRPPFYLSLLSPATEGTKSVFHSFSASSAARKSFRFIVAGGYRLWLRR